MNLVIVPGSFDPMTLGHLDLVKKAAKRYDKVIVAVMINPVKRYCFDMKTRVEIAKLTVADMPQVEVVAEKGLLIDLYDRLGAKAVCKGWRNEADYAYEIKMADWNRAHNAGFRTELIYSHGEHATLSSTEVRALLAKGDSPEGLVHPDALPLILTKLKQGE
ncbi:MAG: pantetheine-phosphate adenylyltransferase [Clostridia bacterium]|nr:pantetheine-phosphate adenylyltransferase [Clostridia bacterium]